MTRLVLVAFMTVVLFTSCVKNEQAVRTAENQPAPPVSTAPPAEPVAPTSTIPEVNQARELIVQGDIKGAIRLLENFAQTQRPMPDELKYALIDAHTRYVQELSVMRTAPLDLLNEVMYSHASRILELDPGHLEAKATRESVLTYYRNRQKTPPALINPVIFLDELMSQSGGPQASGPAEPSGR